MSHETCKDCEHFVRHYIKRSDSYFPIIHGHCMEPLIKSRKADTPACANFSPSNPKKNVT